MHDMSVKLGISIRLVVIDVEAKLNYGLSCLKLVYTSCIYSKIIKSEIVGRYTGYHISDISGYLCRRIENISDLM